MEISDVKRRVVETIEGAKREAAERRGRIDEATRTYGEFLDRIAVPVFKQVSNVLRSEGITFTVFTPSGSVRLMSDRGNEDYIELTLDTTGDTPVVSGHSSRGRGRRILESERPVGPPATLTEDDVLTFLLKELAPLVER
jgi:hypothetical protein